MDSSETRRARLISMMWRFTTPQILHALVGLGIADLLADGPAGCAELAAQSGAHSASLYRILRAAVSLDLVSLQEGQFALTGSGELLRADVPGSVHNLVKWICGADSRQAWAALEHSIRTGQSAFREVFGKNFFEYLRLHPEKAAIFNAAMVEMSHGVAQALIVNHGIARHARIADVGGGSGGLLAGLLAANGKMHGLLYDTVSGLRDASTTLSAANVQDRCEVVPGDFFISVPKGCDAYLLNRVIHDWDDDQAITILRHCRGAMTPDAMLYLVETVLPDDPSAMTCHAGPRPQHAGLSSRKGTHPHGVRSVAQRCRLATRRRDPAPTAQRALQSPHRIPLLTSCRTPR